MKTTSSNLAATFCLATLQALSAQESSSPASPTERPLVAALNTFAADLHRQLTADGDPICSPASISLALLALLPGARGETGDEIATVLHLPADLRGEALNAAAKDLVALAGMRQDSEVPHERKAVLQLRNDFWSQPGFELLPAYATALQDCFGTALHEIDFLADTERARREINVTISNATNGRISEVLPKGALHPRTRHLMTSALWLRARWRHEFERTRQPQPFHVTPERTVHTPMMRHTDWLPYAECDAWQAVQLLMKGGTLQFEISLPRTAKSLDLAEQALLRERPLVTAIERSVQITMPPFKVRGDHSLRASLQALGIHATFSNRANFTGIDRVLPISFEDVLHRTWVQVDHKGIEAAAATGAVSTDGPAGPGEKPIPFVADRPFAFAIRDAATGLLLFFGRVTDPSNGS